MTQEVLKLALDALYPIAHNTTDDPRGQAYKAITLIKEALAQPKKEPIAYINVEKRTLEFAKQIFWHTPTVANLDRIPLYTQRTWVGLTDDEMEATFIQCGGKWNGDFWKIEDADFHPFLRTIEAKLKDKNT